jgi:hypothetical protein
MSPTLRWIAQKKHTFFSHNFSKRFAVFSTFFLVGCFGFVLCSFVFCAGRPLAAVLLPEKKPELCARHMIRLWADAGAPKRANTMQL